MKVTFALVFAIIFVMFSANLLRSQDSGWEDRGTYKYEKLRIDSLKWVKISGDGSKFYTYNNSELIRVWDYTTGKLIDTIKLNAKPNTLFFSSDGKSVVYCYNTSTQYFKDLRYVVLDLNTQKHIGAASMDLTTILANSHDGQYADGYFDFLIMDYFSENNKILMSFKGIKAGGYSGSSGSYADDTGSGGLFSIENDSIVPLKTISTNKIINAVLINDSLFYTTYESGQTTATHYTSNGNSSMFGIYNLNKDSNFIKLKYSYSYYHDSQNQTSTESGVYFPMTHVFYIPNTNKILIKSVQNICYFDLHKDTIVDSQTLISNNDYIEINSENTILTQLSYSKLYHYHILDKKIFDSVDCPIQSDNFCITNDNNKIITYNKSGEIALFKSYMQNKSYDFLASDTLITLTDSVSFYLLNSEKYSSVMWSFGDGEYSNETNPVHSFSKSGDYTISLEITDSSGEKFTVTKENYIHVRAPLKADFTTIDTVGSVPFTVHFNNTSTGEIVKNRWDFGDGTFGLTFAATHTYLKGGIYSVKLVVEDRFSKDSITKVNLIYVDRPETDSLSIIKNYKINFVISHGPPIYSIKINNFACLANARNSSLLKLSGSMQEYTINGTSNFSSIGNYNSTSDSFGYITDSEWGQIIYQAYDKVYTSVFYQSAYYLNQLGYDFRLNNSIQLIHYINSLSMVDSIYYVGMQGIIKIIDYSFHQIDSIAVPDTVLNIFPITQDHFYYYAKSDGTDKIVEVNEKTIVGEHSLMPSEGKIIINKTIRSGVNTFIVIGSNKGSTNSGYMAKFDFYGRLLKESFDKDYTDYNKIENYGTDKFYAKGTSKKIGFIIIDTNLHRIGDYVYKTPPNAYTFYDIGCLKENTFLLTGKVKSSDLIDVPTITKFELPSPVPFFSSVNHISQTLEELELYPNPASNSLYISLDNVSPGKYHFEIFDIMGNKVISSDREIASMPSTLHYDISSLPHGLYFVKISDGKSILTGKFVKK